MPGYNAFIPDYLSPQNLTLSLEDGPVGVTPRPGSLFGPVEVDDPLELGAAISALVPGQTAMVIWPEDAQDTFPEPVAYEPIPVDAPVPQNLALAAPAEDE
jgi:hypothetical protein